MKQRVNSFFNEIFKLFKIIYSYLSFRRFFVRFLMQDCWKGIACFNDVLFNNT